MSTLKEKAELILNEKEEKIIPENIRNGVEIFNIIGKYQGSGGSGDVKLFETEEEMQNDQDVNEGDLAIVYRKEINSVDENTEFNSCMFPSTVVLNEAVTSNIFGSFGATDESWFNGMVMIKPTEFSFEAYAEERIQISYTSTDGITYTRTDGGTEIIELGNTVKYEPYEPWNNTIGYFMKVSGNYFGGLFRYTLNHRTEKIRFRDFSTAEITISGNNISSYTANNLLPMEFELEDLYKVLENNNMMRGSYYINTSGNLKLLDKELDDIMIDSSANAIGVGRYDGTDNLTIYDVDLATHTISNGVTYTPEKSISYYYYFSGINDFWSTLLSFDIASPRKYTEGYTCVFNANNSVRGGGYKDLYVYEDKYIYDKNNLDATAGYVYNKTLYGKNGVEYGTLCTAVNNKFIDTNAEVYAALQEAYNNMQPIVLTDANKEIDKTIYVLPSKIDGTPLIDTSELTNATDLFSSSNIKTLFSLDTHNVVNMSCMFNHCRNLESVPLFDTSKVTNVYAMFNECHKLKSVPGYDLSNVTDIHAMFEYCYDLKTIPLFNTISATNFRMMCYGCSSLENVPALNTVNATDISNMFDNCSNLTNESLNNIMQMCIDAVKIQYNKTLKNIGLSQEQTEICQTLSNYQNLLNAGWTTGY